MSTSKKVDKKQSVMDATLELVSEYGFHGTSTAMIAKKANVGMGTIYRYFKTKDEIINTLFLDIKLFFTENLLKKDDLNLDIKKRFSHIWIALVKLYIEYPQQLKFIEQYANSPFLSKETIKKQKQLIEVFTKLFEQGIKEKVFLDLPISVLRAMLYGSALQLAKAHLQKKIKLSDNLLEKTFEACWRGIIKN